MAGEGRKGASANCQKAARGTDFPVRSLSGVRFSLLLSVFTFCNDDLTTKLSHLLILPIFLTLLYYYRQHGKRKQHSLSSSKAAAN